MSKKPVPSLSRESSSGDSSRALSRGAIDQLAIDLAFHELEAEEKRRTLLRHYREGARLPKRDSWLLRGHEYDVLLTRAGVVSVRSQEGVRKLDTWVAKQWFERIFIALDHTKDSMRASPGDLPRRVLKLLKLSRHWRVKPEYRRAAAKAGRPARRSAQREGVAA